MSEWATVRFGLWLSAGCLFAGILLTGCETGVEDSSDPAVLRVTLQADPSDNTITVGGKTYEASPGDRFEAVIFQGKIYRDSVCATLLSDLDEFRERELSFNLLARASAIRAGSPIASPSADR